MSTLSGHASALDVMLTAGAILPLLLLLGSVASEEVQEHALTVLVRLSAAPTFPQQFVAAGAVPPLVQMLRSELPLLVQRSALSLLGILTTTESQDAFAPINSAGAQPLLARLQRSPNSDEGTKLACGMLMVQLTTRGAPPSGFSHRLKARTPSLLSTALARGPS